MAPSRLELSEHANERLRQRCITRDQIRRVLRQSSQLTTSDINGRKIKEKKFGKKILVVVYLDILGGQLIVTAYWKGVL